MLNRQGRPSQAGESAMNSTKTFTGNRALEQVEPLLFEIGRLETTGVDLDEPQAFTPRLGGLERHRAGQHRLPGARVEAVLGGRGAHR